MAATIPGADSHATLEIASDPPAAGGEADGQFTFAFTYRAGASFSDTAALLTPQADEDEIRLHWMFGDGSYGEEWLTPDSSGQASPEVKHTYTDEGSWGIVVVAEDSAGNELAEAFLRVVIGETTGETAILPGCDGPDGLIVSGARGVFTVAVDLSDMPEGYVFNVGYDMQRTPDRLIVEYPLGNVVLDTGRRGDAEVGDNPQFPGGITGPGKGTDYAVFTKGAADEATVTIIAPGRNTRWSYWAKCSEPGWRVPEAD